MEKTEKVKVDYDDPEMSVFFLLNEYADREISFKNSFFESCEKMLENNGYLSGNQINLLIDIYEEIMKKEHESNQN